MFMDQRFLLFGFYASVFMSTLLCVYGFWQLHNARRLRAAALHRRLRDRARAQAGHGRPGNLRREPPDIVREYGVHAAPMRRLARALDQAGLPYSINMALAGIAGLAIVTILATTALAILFDLSAGLAWLAPVLVSGGGIGVTAAYLRYRKARRLARFAALLPDALDVMVRSLRAGHPVATSMSMVASDLPAPIAGEFSKAVNEMTYGLDLREALSHLAERVEAEDLHFVVATVRLQHETGGNLAEVLQRLADLIRVRARLTRKVHAFTAEARLSARILAVMPVIFVALIFWANPEIYSSAARDPIFFPALLAAGGLQVIGILVMGRMARIRV